MSVIQKLGVLRKNTIIHTEDLDFKVERGTIIFVSENTLRFNDKGIVAYRKGEYFYVKSEFSQVPHRVFFPDGGVPYPFTML
jgi:tyrosine-protein phosphatase YwqE